jgi:hypothetical protein
MDKKEIAFEFERGIKKINASNVRNERMNRE